MRARVERDEPDGLRLVDHRLAAEGADAQRIREHGRGARRRHPQHVDGRAADGAARGIDITVATRCDEGCRIEARHRVLHDAPGLRPDRRDVAVVGRLVVVVDRKPEAARRLRDPRRRVRENPVRKRERVLRNGAVGINLRDVPLLGEPDIAVRTQHHAVVHHIAARIGIVRHRVVNLIHHDDRALPGQRATARRVYLEVGAHGEPRRRDRAR